MITAQQARELVKEPTISNDQLFHDIKTMSELGNAFLYQAISAEQIQLLTELGYSLEANTIGKPTQYRISW